MKIWVRILCRFGKAIDIRLYGKYPANVLSNLCGNTFVLDGVECKSMEGFLQSLKIDDSVKQRQVCSMKGKKAKNHSTNAWKAEQIVNWRGEKMSRQSREFRLLLERAYQALFDQNARFREALLLTRGKTIYHTMGSSDPNETILTRSEFCDILTGLREEKLNGLNKDYPDKQFCNRKYCPFRKKC